MAATVKVFQLSQEEDRFRFEAERSILGRTIEGIEVRPDRVALSLSDGSFVAFRVDGADIVITVPLGPERPTLDMTIGPVQ